jgi:hypothetical protein
MNIYCIPREPGSVPWPVILGALAERAFILPPYRAGTPFRDDADRSNLRWPENWIAPETLGSSNSSLPLRDFRSLTDALAYIEGAGDATITMAAPQSSFSTFPDAREFHGALALYRFSDPVPFRVGVPEDVSDLVDEFPHLARRSRQPKWEGTLTELLWLHEKCVPPEDEFVGSPVGGLLQSFWRGYKLLADEFL